MMELHGSRLEQNAPRTGTALCSASLLAKEAVFKLIMQKRDCEGTHGTEWRVYL